MDALSYARTRFVLEYSRRQTFVELVCTFGRLNSVFVSSTSVESLFFSLNLLEAGGFVVRTTSRTQNGVRPTFRLDAHPDARTRFVLATGQTVA